MIERREAPRCANSGALKGPAGHFVVDRFATEGAAGSSFGLARGPSQ